MQPLPHRNSTLQQERADLIDDTGALTDQSLAHPMQRLKVELVSALGGDELHGRALHRFRDRLGIAIVVLFTFAIRAHIFRRHQPGVMAKRLKVAAEMMRADAGFHPDQAWPYIGEPRFDLAARPLLPQHDAAAPILADEVERILADIDPDYGNFDVNFRGHGLLLCLRCPGQLASLAGLEYGRAIPLADSSRVATRQTGSARASPRAVPPDALPLSRV